MRLIDDTHCLGRVSINVRSPKHFKKIIYFTALKENHFKIFFLVTAAGAATLGDPKSSPVHRPYCNLCFTFGPLRSAEIF